MIGTIRRGYQRRANSVSWLTFSWKNSIYTVHFPDLLAQKSESLAELSDASENVTDFDTLTPFSDPESEWASAIDIDESEDNQSTQFLPDLRPESEQPTASQTILRKAYQVPSFTYQDELDPWTPP